MAKWRYNGKPIREVVEHNLTGLRIRVRLEPGDMIQHISGQLPVRDIANSYNSTLTGKTGYRFSVVSTDYSKKRWGWNVDIKMVGIDDGYNMEGKLFKLMYEPYAEGVIKIYPVDSTDKW